LPLELSAGGFLDGCFDAGTEQIIGLIKTIDELLLERCLGSHHFVKGIEDLDHLRLELKLRTIRVIFDLFALGPKPRLDACDSSCHIGLVYAPGARPAGAPDSIFVKFRPPGLTERLFGNILALGPNEVGFYRDIAGDVPVRAPECYCARDGAGEFVLVLEDLASKGAQFRTIADPISLDEAKAVVAALARLHASFREPPRLAVRFPWLRSPDHNPNAAIERFLCASAHRPTLARFPHLLPESLRRGAHQIHKKRKALERYWADGPLTLIHGYPHLGNLYFVDAEPGFFDWQVLQRHQGIRDVAYFSVLSLDTEVRRAHERELVRLYQETLRDGGVPNHDLDRDKAWEHYRSFSMYAYLGTSVTTSMSDLQPRHIAELGLKRAATAVDDLDALALLEAL
jgi:hypothetical protein